MVMVFLVKMFMVVLQRIVRVFMPVLLSQMQPAAQGH